MTPTTLSRHRILGSSSIAPVGFSGCPSPGHQNLAFPRGVPTLFDGYWRPDMVWPRKGKQADELKGLVR